MIRTYQGVSGVESLSVDMSGKIYREDIGDMIHSSD